MCNNNVTSVQVVVMYNCTFVLLISSDVFLVFFSVVFGVFSSVCFEFTFVNYAANDCMKNLVSIMTRCIDRKVKVPVP